VVNCFPSLRQLVAQIDGAISHKSNAVSVADKRAVTVKPEPGSHRTFVSSFFLRLALLSQGAQGT